MAKLAKPIAQTGQFLPPVRAVDCDVRAIFFLADRKFGHWIKSQHKPPRAHLAPPEAELLQTQQEHQRLCAELAAARRGRDGRGSAASDEAIIASAAGAVDRPLPQPSPPGGGSRFSAAFVLWNLVIFLARLIGSGRVDCGDFYRCKDVVFSKIEVQR